MYLMRKLYFWSYEGRIEYPFIAITPRSTLTQICSFVSVQSMGRIVMF